MSPLFWIWGLSCLLCLRGAQGRDTPADEMQKFIDECNYMIYEMNHCAEGWVDLEQEMIDSMHSFVDKIVYTESLILEESELILDMADRIIQTEVIMIDLVETCDCSSPMGLRGNGGGKHAHVLRNKTSREGGVLPASKFLVVSFKDPVPQQVTTVTTLSNKSAVSFDKCSVMDDIILVMDACIDAFVVYNDDFLQVLSYMDSAILDMGTRIVNTECLIVNMSYQIGEMADLIVETEVLMADMAASCCRDQNSDTPHEKVKAVPLPPLNRTTTGDDDLLTDCDFDGSHRRTVEFKHAHALALAETARKKFQDKLQELPPITRQIGRASYLKQTLLPALTSTPPVHDVMPCDTWWDPFCCAAEVCADMMVAMIEMMAEGADWMTEVCEECIDEIGELADVIVKTEENIILMGYAIQDMADYIVVFIDEGLEFMVVFCPNTKKTYSIQGDLKLKSTVSKDKAAVLKSGGGVKFKTFVEQMLVSQNVTVSKRPLPMDVSKRVAKQQAAAEQLKDYQKVGLYFSELKENPFGEFVAMVDVMMEAMMLFTNILADQTRLMTEMFESLMSLSLEETAMAGSVVSMGGEVAAMGADLQEAAALMDELDDCIH